MKRINRILSVLLIALMIMTSAPLAGFAGLQLPAVAPKARASAYLTSGFCGDTSDGGTEKDIYWELSEDGVLTITGTGKMKPEAFNYDLRIKEVIIGDGITNISAHCFSQCTNLVKVTMGDDVETIDNYAFNECGLLLNVVFPAGVKSIGDGAFADCSTFKEIILPEGLETIGGRAFAGCAISELYIPETLMYIEQYAFSFCLKLESVYVGASVNNLLYNTFSQCSELREITVSVNNTMYSSADGIVYNKEQTELYIVPEGISGEITIPATVEKLSSVSVTDCTKLTDIHVDEKNVSIKSINGIVYSADGKTLIVCPRGKSGSVSIAEDTEIISNAAFSDCKYITNVSFPSSLIHIGAYAFSDAAIDTLELPEGLETIDSLSFSNCDNITSVFLPDSVTCVDYGAFSFCNSLTSAYIGAGVNSFAENAFNYSSALSAITVSENNKSYASVDGILYNKEKTRMCIVPESISGEINVPSTVEQFAVTAVDKCKKLTAIHVEKSNLAYKSVDGIVYTVNGKTLIVCPRGKKGNVTVAAGTEVIDTAAFRYCDFVSKIDLPEGLISIKSEAFSYCTNLETIILPETVTSIGAHAFSMCKELSTIIIPKKITRVNDSMFSYSGFTELTFPETVQSFDHANWSRLKTFTIENRYCEYTSTTAPIFHKDCTIRAYCGSLGHTLATKRLLNFESIGHTYLDWYVVSPATYEAEGIMRRDCAYCDGYEEKTIPQLQNDVFTATFVANGEVVATIDFAKGTTEIAEPKVPAKDRYMGEWEDYTLNDADITINAVYTLIKSDDASEIETDSEVIHYTDKDDVLFKIKAWADALVVKSTVSKSVPLDIVLVVDQSGSMEDTLGGRTKKVDALKETATDFVNTVFENAKITDADHRISIVGFGLSGNYQGFEKNENTELLTSANGIVKFDDIKTTDYASSLLSVNVDGNVNEALLTAINAIDAKGATAADLGFEMAKGVFANSDSEGRQRVVVFMTDGEPTYLSGFQTSVANAAIYNASLLKTAYDASVYSVGVFSEADSRNRNINKFMNAVSSGYPDAVSMSWLGDGVDGQYYLTVSNTDSLSSVFKTISTESLSHTAPFDDITLIKTLSENVTMTTRQEEQLRIDVIRKYGISNDDIIITRNDDGTTTIQINGLTPYEVTDSEGNIKYEVAVEFFASLNEKASVAGDYVVDTDDSGVMLGADAKGYEATFETSTINLTSKKTRVIFTVNGEVYEVSENISGGYAVAPEIEVSEDWVFSGWDTSSQKASNGLTLDATITKAPRTVTWHTADGDIIHNYYKGDIITAPTVGMTADGKVFLSWDKSIPTTMPDENLVFNAVYGGHVHNYTSEITKKMTCTEDGIRTYTCVCSDTYDEVITAIGHNYEAITPSLEKEDAKCTFCCTNCGDKYDYALEYEVVEATGKKTRVLYEFNLTDDELNTDIQPDGAIQIRIPLSELHGSAEHVTVIRTNDDGSKTQVPAYHEKGFLVITCDHFTPYEVFFDIPCEGHVQGEWIVEKEPTCTQEGYRYALCTECEKKAFEETISKLSHNYTATVTAPTCTEKGFTTFTCSCGDMYTSDFVDTISHSDTDGDLYCDFCSESLAKPAPSCSHMCHKDGFMGFIWKIINFFQKLFGTSPVCECGAAHY